MRLPIGTTVALLLVVTAGCASPLLGGPPEATVENHDDSAYRVVTYTVDEIHEKTGFYATTANGTRRLVGYEDVWLSRGYRNVTLADDTGASKQEFTVEPNSTVTTAIDEWDRSDSTLYLVETHDGEVVHTNLVRCQKRGQPHWIEFPSDENFKSDSTCT